MIGGEDTLSRYPRVVDILVRDEMERKHGSRKRSSIETAGTPVSVRVSDMCDKGGNEVHVVRCRRIMDEATGTLTWCDVCFRGGESDAKYDGCADALDVAKTGVKVW